MDDDVWRHCWLCDLIIDKDRRFKKKEARALWLSWDHVVPQSLGGRWNNENIRPAHRFCNTLRGSGDVTPEFQKRMRTVMLKRWNMEIADLERQYRNWIYQRSSGP